MAEERFDSDTRNLFRDWLRWTEIFRTFRVALDPKKLLLSAAGILFMALGWWLISWAFYNGWSKPNLENWEQVPSTKDMAKKSKYASLTEQQREEKHKELEEERKQAYDEYVNRWVQLHILAGSDYEDVTYSDNHTIRVWGGQLRTLPWYEDRGPNPYLLVTSQVDRPWPTGHFVEWFMTREVPVLIEPLAKFMTPIIQLLNPKNGTYTRIYLLVILFWTLLVWAFFGGMVTRMAAVELAGKDSISVPEAFRFVTARYWSYLCGPLVPILLIALLVVFSIIFGLFQLIPAFGDFFSGLLWPIIILFGLGMALLLVGLVGYPLMYPTISVEGSDTLDALSRSYNYVYQSPWNYLWYSFLAICYGAVVVFFVGFLGSMTVYLGKWAISNTPFIERADRKPEYLFIYSPTSFGWRQLLLKDSKGEALATLEEEDTALRRYGAENTEMAKAIRRDHSKAQEQYNEWMEGFYTYNKIAAGMVSFWVTLLFMCVLGFGYSFFWTSSTMIYLLMRKKVDDTDMDEVYLEETEPTDPYPPPTTPMPTTPLPTVPPPNPSAPVMVDAPTLRTDKPAPPSDTPPPPAPPTS
jgi:hypothetical protein